MSDYVIRKGKSIFKFPSSGEEVEIYPVSMSVQADIEEEWEATRPQPPVEKVPVGDGATFVEEKRWGDSEYQLNLQEWSNHRNLAVMDEMIRLGVSAKVDQKAVDQLRRYYAERRKVELDPDDHFVYVRYILLKNGEDVAAFMRAINGRSNPTEGAVASAIENTFPGNS